MNSYDIAGLHAVLETYAGLSHDDLCANLAGFLRAAIPIAAELGINLCIHPDDPLRSILGLSRIVSSAQDIRWIMQAVDEPANGLTLCTGSLGAHPKNDLPDIARAFASRIHFVHLRNVTKAIAGSFAGGAHLAGGIDFVAVVDELLEAETARGLYPVSRRPRSCALVG